jgi:hypothetical protein
MVAPHPGPNLEAPSPSTRRSVPPPTTHHSLPSLFFPVYERSTPLLLITSLQPQQFHAITHSFAQRRAVIPCFSKSLRTLSITTGVYLEVAPDDKLSRLQARQLFCLHRPGASLPSLFALFYARFLCFQSVAASFPKTPGWGGYHPASSLRISPVAKTDFYSPCAPCRCGLSGYPSSSVQLRASRIRYRFRNACTASLLRHASLPANIVRTHRIAFSGAARLSYLGGNRKWQPSIGKNSTVSSAANSSSP